MRASPAAWCKAPANVVYKLQAIGWSGAIYALSLLAGGAALAAVPTSAQQDNRELRRAQEQEKQLRELQERAPDVRTPAPELQPLRLIEGETPCITIRQLELRGDESNRFGWVLDTLAGPQGDDGPLKKCLGAKSVGVLVKRAQDALVSRGYVTSRIFTLPQDMASGNLVFTVIPGRIGAIRFSDGTPANITSLRTALPVKSGDILNLRDIEQALENLKRVPTADADIQIAPSAQPAQSDLVISYKSVLPLRVSLSADDSGTKSTGRYQGSATLSWDNPLGLNDLAYLTSSHDLGGGDPGPRGTRGLTVHYSVPYGYWTLGTTLSDSRYYQTVVGINQNYVYSGTSGNAEIKLSRLVYRDALRKTTLHLKAFERHSKNYVDDTEIQVQRRAIGGWEWGLGHKEFVGPATLEGNLAYKRGTDDFDSIRAPEEATGEGTSRFGLIAADVSLAWPFKVATQALRYNTVLRVQDNTTPLTPQDRFSIGGRYTVRGFEGDASLSGDRGYLLRNEMSAALGSSGQEIYFGIDHGEVYGPSTSLLVGNRLTGAVLGLRGGFKKLQYEVFVGTPLYKPEGFKASDTAAGFNLNISF